MEGVAEDGQAAAQGGQAGAVEQGAAGGDLVDEVGAQAAGGVEGGQLFGPGGDEEWAAQAIGGGALLPVAQLGLLGGGQGGVSGGFQQPTDAVVAEPAGGGGAERERGEGQAAVGLVVAQGQQLEEQAGVAIGAEAEAPLVTVRRLPDGQWWAGEFVLIGPAGEGLAGEEAVGIGDDAGQTEVVGGGVPGGRGGGIEEGGPQVSRSR